MIFELFILSLNCIDLFHLLSVLLCFCSEIITKILDCLLVLYAVYGFICFFTRVSFAGIVGYQIKDLVVYFVFKVGVVHLEQRNLSKVLSLGIKIRDSFCNFIFHFAFIDSHYLFLQ